MSKNQTPGTEPEKRYEYKPIRQTLKKKELGTYVTYGIDVKNNKQRITLVSDVTTNEYEAHNLASKCTKEQLDPIQLEEIIEDFLVDLTL